MSPLPLRIVEAEGKIVVIDDKGTYCMIPIEFNFTQNGKLGEISEVGRSKQLLKELSAHTYAPIEFQSYDLLLNKLLAIPNAVKFNNDLSANDAKCLYYVCTLIEKVKAVKI